MQVFSDQRGIAADKMTLAMFLILTRYGLSMTAGWQRYTRTPSEESLTPACITRLVQRTTNDRIIMFLSERPEKKAGKEAKRAARRWLPVFWESVWQ